jgi:YhcH/YjgK/YiaL family protein
MILDRLEHVGRYRGLDPLLDRGLEALRRLTDAPPQADGRLELEGEELYASLSTYQTGDPVDKPFEAHRRYIDIQALLRGREVLFWAPLAGLRPLGGYSEDEDLAVFEDPPGGGAGLALAAGSFVVLFPQDAHKPGCRAQPARGSGRSVRKLVLKVRVGRGA